MSRPRGLKTKNFHPTHVNSSHLKAVSEPKSGSPGHILQKSILTGLKKNNKNIISKNLFKPKNPFSEEEPTLNAPMEVYINMAHLDEWNNMPSRRKKHKLNKYPNSIIFDMQCRANYVSSAINEGSGRWKSFL